MLIRDLLKETGREGGRNVIAPLSVLSLLVVFFFSSRHFENKDIICCEQMLSVFCVTFVV